ncbi:SDR family oxidoreductase [Pseudodonghicola flavimaris]|uniref:SDR family oxidoreductase n=1 Tax=Pseudodonghicola flavimaris TaxID=3050036 RepID=A0ABT7EVC7_9RHOB|nr:SDR family oxidoreductase [Pseudodonghicola flavimaris]MDK3016291.1 SDR family oxidoreductase [Pseudodonghicola flavimaris]
MRVARVALIFAGGSGMGADAARRLHADGFEVGILSSSGKGAALAEELGGLGFTGSNLEPADLKAFVDAALARWGRIDVVVNSAGHGPSGDLLEVPDEDWHAGLDIFLMNVIRVARLVTPIMVAQKDGVILNISTFAALEPQLRFAVSNVFRAGLASFTKLYSDRYGPDNVRMNNVLPGFIDSLPIDPARSKEVPLARYGRMEEVSATLSFLASPGAGYITGQNIRIDGGATRSL